MNIEVVRFALIFNFFCISCRLSDTKQREGKRRERERPKTVGPGGLWLSSDREGFVLGLRQG